MSLVGNNYDSSSSEDERETLQTSIRTVAVNSTPDVPSISQTNQKLSTSSTLTLHANYPINVLNAPMNGPINPYTVQQPIEVVGSGKQILTGVVEGAHMEEYSFNQRHRELNGAREMNVVKKKKVSGKRRRANVLEEEEIGDDEDHGIWGPVQKKIEQAPIELTEEQKALQEKRRKRKENHKTMDEEVDFDRMVEKKTSHLLPQRLQSGQTACKATTHFHDPGNEYDYQGRSWIVPPSTLKPVDPEDLVNYVPKVPIHTWAGHSKGVQTIEFFPKYGHLLLSASLDNSIKIWDVMNERNCKRTYNGHSNGVRDVRFSNDGKQFLSCSYDRFIRLWDTETGQCIQTFTNRRVPYCVRFYPKDNNQFLIGDSNNMVVQFDCKSGEVVQEYNHHLQAVNSVTFVDDDKRFVSTSDDKKILIWEYNIPVPIKYISEPSMHSMPAVTLHPSGQFFAGQSMNNQIDVYSARDKFKLNRKKTFKGHMNAGYACQIDFSPNGKFITSGDGNGRFFIWDWKTSRMFKKYQAHERGPCLKAAWHPIEQSKVATCGWDGLIKYWD